MEPLLWLHVMGLPLILRARAVLHLVPRNRWGKKQTMQSLLIHGTSTKSLYVSAYGRRNREKRKNVEDIMGIMWLAHLNGKSKKRQENGHLEIQEEKNNLFGYARHVLQRWLQHFAKQHKETQPKILVVKYKATPHTNAFQEDLYLLSETKRVLWLGNSPDVKMIQPV
jgi:hypothetical protein